MYYTIQAANNKGSDQTARMLIWLAVNKSTVMIWRRLIEFNNRNPIIRYTQAVHMYTMNMLKFWLKKFCPEKKK